VISPQSDIQTTCRAGAAAANTSTTVQTNFCTIYTYQKEKRGMSKTKLLSLILIALLLGTVLVACQQATETTAPEPEVEETEAVVPEEETEAPAPEGDEDRFTIGISNPFISSEYRTQMIASLIEVNQEYMDQGIGTELVIESADTDVAGQIQQLQNLIAKETRSWSTPAMSAD